MYGSNKYSFEEVGRKNHVAGWKKPTNEAETTLDDIIKRIDSIEWNLVGANASKADGDLGYEYLRRLAKFFKDESIRPITPLVANIAKLLGDANEQITISNYCSQETVEFLGDHIYMKNIIVYYIQLAKYADKTPEAIKYLSVYEPLIRILERGGCYTLRINSLDIKNAGYYPLRGWYERFVAKKPISIDEL